MERLHNQNDLAGFLSRQSKRDITIVSAFASGTVELLVELKRDNRVEVIVGTINAFTSPAFIKDASELLKQRMWVDFRGEDSIHWKLYLVSPNTVVIGSANFTQLGVGLHRDTCVVIRNKSLYNDYVEQVRRLKKTAGVLSATTQGFEVAKKKHEEQHRRNQAANQAARATTRNKPTFEQWIKNGFTTIPLYLWDTDILESDKSEARRITLEMTSKQHDAVSSVRRTQPYRDALVTGSEGRRPPFAPGTIVLIASESGGSIGFLQLDIVYRHPQKKQDYMIALFKSRYEEPFQLTVPIKQAIKAMIVAGEHGEYSLSAEALHKRLVGQRTR